MDDEDRNRTYDDCVLKNLTECVEPLGHEPEVGWFKIVPFFCGQDPICVKPCSAALQLAKKHVSENFLVVGILNQMREFMETLEVFLPTFFQGGVHLFDNHEGAFHEKTKTDKKTNISAEIRRMVKDKVAIEYEFFKFVESTFAEKYTIVVKLKKQQKWNWLQKYNLTSDMK